jgi:ribosomal protein S18 acetylase RimI-like enzyme
LVRLTRETGFFRPDEVAVAQELLTESTQKGEETGYQVYVASEGRRAVGYVCFGLTPLTRGTWDIYWIAVHPRHQSRGIGGRLMRRAEEEIRGKGGRLILIETSSQELYEPTRRFYRSLEYQEVSRIPDFYDVGDARVTLAKTLSPGGNGTMSP